jgi:hypothetical protein
MEFFALFLSRRAIKTGMLTLAYDSDVTPVGAMATTAQTLESIDSAAGCKMLVLKNSINTGTLMPIIVLR